MNPDQRGISSNPVTWAIPIPRAYRVYAYLHTSTVDASYCVLMSLSIKLSFLGSCRWSIRRWPRFCMTRCLTAYLPLHHTRPKTWTLVSLELKGHHYTTKLVWQERAFCRTWRNYLSNGSCHYAAHGTRSELQHRLSSRGITTQCLSDRKEDFVGHKNGFVWQRGLISPTEFLPVCRPHCKTQTLLSPEAHSRTSQR